MSRIRHKDTKPELIFKKIVSSIAYPAGLRYRRNYCNLPGKPDLVFISRRVVFSVDGDFWHGYQFEKRLSHKLPQEFWVPKIKANMKRDLKVNRELRKQGWKVFRFWEHEIIHKPKNIRIRVAKALDLDSDSL